MERETHIYRIPPNVVSKPFQPQHARHDWTGVYPHPQFEIEIVLPIDAPQRPEAVHAEHHDIGGMGPLLLVFCRLRMRVRRHLLAVHESADDHVRVPYRLDLLEAVLVR